MIQKKSPNYLNDHSFNRYMLAIGVGFICGWSRRFGYAFLNCRFCPRLIRCGYGSRAD